jgi:hypothetical protein
MLRIEVYEIRDVMPKLPKRKLPNTTYIKFKGIKVNIAKDRYVNFVNKGTTCSKCGMNAEFFALEQQEGQDIGVLNLYGRNKRGEEVIISATTNKRYGKIPPGTILCNDCQQTHVSHSKSIYDIKID